MARITAACTLIIVSGCAATHSIPTGSGSAAELSRQWLVGGWVLAGESCQSDAGVVYRADGTWVAYGAAGTWLIKNGSIVSTVTASGSDNESLDKIREPVRFVERVQVRGPNAYISRGKDGSMRRLQRCPSK